MPGIGDYSTSEQDTGFTWIDGAKIYRKVFSGTITNAAGDRTTKTLWSSSPIDKIVSQGGWVQYGASGANGQNVVPMGEGANEYREVYLQKDSNNLNFALLATEAISNRKYELWVEYTRRS